MMIYLIYLLFNLGDYAKSARAFKSKIEAELFKKAVESPKGILDYKVAYEIAKSMVLPSA